MPKEIRNISMQNGININIDEYFKTVNLKEVVVFIAGLGNIYNYWNQFDQKTRMRLQAEIGWKDSYIAIIDLGADKVKELSGQEYLQTEYKINAKTAAEITSAGINVKPEKAIIRINGVDYSPHAKGINVVVFDRNKGCVVNSFSCDSLNDQNLRIRLNLRWLTGRLDNIALKEQKTPGIWNKKTNLNEYIQNLDLEDSIIFIVSHNQSARFWNVWLGKALLGLKAVVDWRDSYIAVVDRSHNFVYENSSVGFIQYAYESDGIHFELSSAGHNLSPHDSKILANGTNYSLNNTGMNFVVYSKKSHSITEWFSCDTLTDASYALRYPQTTFSENLERVRAGESIANKFCSYDNSNFYVILNRHLGDAIFNLYGLKTFKELYSAEAPLWDHALFEVQTGEVLYKEKAIKKLIVITTEAISGIVRLYDFIDDILILKKADLDALEAYAASGLGFHKNILQDVWVKNRLYGEDWNSNSDKARRFLYGIDEKVFLYGLPRRFINAEMSITPKTAEITALLIKSFRLDIKKTVVLCPVARSSSMLDYSVWDKFVLWLRKKGFQVFTNVAGNEKILDGTEALSVDIDVLACMGKMGCRIIGVQCGLLEVLASLNLPLVCISVIRNANDKRFSHCPENKEVLRDVNGVTYLRIEHFEEEYVLKLLEENFH